MSDSDVILRAPTVEDCLAVQPQIEAALAYDDGCFTFLDIATRILKGTMQLFRKGESVIVTEVVNYPQKRVCSVFLAAGKQDELRAMAHAMEPMAVAVGCTEAVLYGRKGWLRSFLQADGWEQDERVTLRKTLDRRAD